MLGTVAGAYCLILHCRRCFTKPFHSVVACMRHARIIPGDEGVAAVDCKHVPLVKEKQLPDANGVPLGAESFWTLWAAHTTPLPLIALLTACLLVAVEL
jgi:hypothetical protein